MQQHLAARKVPPVELAMSPTPPDRHPRLASAVQMRRTHRGMVLAAPDGRDYCEVAPRVLPWLEALDGTHTPEELTARFGPEIGPFIDDLRSSGYLEDSPPHVARKITITGQGIEIAGADRLVRAIYPLARPLISPFGAALVLALGLLGILSPVLGLLDLDARLISSPLVTALALIGTSYLLGFLHELAHALVLQHYGAAIGRVGAGFYWGELSFYVDASAVLMLPRRARMWQASAGVLMEAALAGLCVIISSILPPGTVRELILQTAALAIIGVLINATPLLQLDGYWLLADLLDVPNIYRHALDVISAETGSTMRRWLLGLYVLAAALFGVGLLVAAAVVWMELFLGIIAALWSTDWIGRLVAIILLLPLAGLIIQPLGHLLTILRRRMATRAS